ncbi:Uncharacterised protein [Streptococcus pneumoniae]|nr:Uncharacterised protein [Streptococcus pneumoniae]
MEDAAFFEHLGDVIGDGHGIALDHLQRHLDEIHLVAAGDAAQNHEIEQKQFGEQDLGVVGGIVQLGAEFHFERGR